MLPLTAFLALLAFQASPSPTPGGIYAWLSAYDPGQSLERRVPLPPGYTRVAVDRDSFAAWLRGLPLRPGRPAVRLYDGRLKANQEAHHAVVDIDVGARDLQQCADAVIRLRAEYLRAQEQPVGFRFTSGHLADLARWTAGERPRVAGRSVRWVRSAAPDSSYASFRAYLDALFTYAGSASLARELRAVSDPAALVAGDVFIQPGFPGHAVIVLDVATHAPSGGKAFLLAQSYMPAQEMHVLRNPAAPDLSPWYLAGSSSTLETPEWTFRREHLRRF